MSDAARPGLAKMSLRNLGAFALFSGASRAGPRRLMLIAGGVIGIAGLVVAITMSGHRAPPFSSDARMGSVDPFPGGLHSTPEQDALAVQADTSHAAAALTAGRSYTPPIAPSAPLVSREPGAQPAAARTLPPPQPHFVASRVPVIIAAPALPVTPVADPEPAPPSPPTVVVHAVDPQVQAAYQREIGDLFSQWGGRPPETEVVLPPKTVPAGGSGNGATDGPATASGSAGARVGAPVAHASNQEPEKVLIPAGRGVFAHPVLALSSDQTSPAVFQADSGPIAGDRMIGSFSREKDRLIIHVSQIIHDNQSIGCNGVVIAPDTMEASVATGVDEHYLTRFILPAAAAFVEGLGQALATTSNTAAVLSPLGGVTTSTNLNFRQQLGVAAGVAAGQIGNVLNQAAPKGPTVTLDANVAVGVMFLSDVKVRANE